jgi:hypothetical protein
MEVKSLTPFQSFAKQQIIIALANGSKLVKKTDEPPEVKPSKKMDRDAFRRLTKIRKGDVVKKQIKEIKRSVYVPLSSITNHVPEPVRSRMTKEILHQSQYGQLSLEERGKKLEERRADRLKKLADEQDESKDAPKPTPMPELSAEMKEKLEQRKERLRNRGPDEPSFRPSITPFSEFLKIQQSMWQHSVKPEGWDAAITRQRAGYEMHLKKKAEEAEGIDLLRLRAASRGRQSLRRAEPSDNSDE